MALCDECKLYGEQDRQVDTRLRPDAPHLCTNCWRRTDVPPVARVRESRDAESPSPGQTGHASRFLRPANAPVARLADPLMADERDGTLDDLPRDVGTWHESPQTPIPPPDRPYSDSLVGLTILLAALGLGMALGFVLGWLIWLSVAR